MKVPITRPWFDDTDLEAVQGPLRTGWVVQGPNVARFEVDFCTYTAANAAVACTSATTGLHLALEAVGVGPGDSVLVPAFTWVASANAVRYCGAEPILCDIDLSTFNIDVADAAKRVTANTRAIMPVHLFGRPAPMAAIADLATKHGLKVIEDAACGLGAFIGDQHVGTLGDAGAFSFHPRKAITTGEGGMVTTNDLDLAERMRVLRNHGGSVDPDAPKGPHALGNFEITGFNYRMTDIQGALGVSQMAKVPEIQRRRTRLAKRYDERLTEFSWLRCPQVETGMTHGYQSYVVLFAPKEPTLAHLPALNTQRNALMAGLAERGVSTRPGTHAVHALGTYRRTGLSPTDRPNAWLAEKLSIALPLFPTMSDAEHDYVIAQLRAAYSAI